MTIRDFYAEIGGSFETALKQLQSEGLVERFSLKFLNDPTFSRLTETVNNKDWDQAFMHAHTLKGLTLNFAFVNLSQAAIKLTDALRENNKPFRIDEDLLALYADVKKEYDFVIEKMNYYIEHK